MQSWLLWNMIGFYPITGQTTFLIHSPWFEHLKIDLGNGKNLVINSTGGDKDTAIHVQSLKVNGKDWKRSWLTWDDVFATGGTMDFVLGSNPITAWFNMEDLPPSPASSASAPGLMSDLPVETVTAGEGVAASTDTEALSQADCLDKRPYALLSLWIVTPIVCAAVLMS